MKNLNDALGSKDRIKLNKLNDIISDDEIDEQSLLIISSDTIALNLKLEKYLTTNINHLIKIETVQDDLFKKILSNIEGYKNKYILINLFSIDDYKAIREEFQFKRDYIPQERLKFIFLLNFAQYESFKTKAYDFFSFNNFFHHFIDNTYTFVNDVDLTELDDMIEEYEKIKDTNISKQSRMKYLLNIGKKAFNFSQYKFSLEYLNQALKLATKLKDIFMIANISSLKGNIYENFGDLKKALEYHKESLRISKKIKYQKGISSSLGNIGHAYIGLGNIELSLSNYQKVLDISIKEKDKKHETQALGDIGALYQIKGNLDLANKYLHESLTNYKSLGNIKGEASILINIANLHRDKGEFDTSLKYQNKALSIFKEVGYMKGVAEALNAIAKTHEKLKNFELVEKYSDEALEIAKSLGFHAIISKIEQNKINNNKER